MVSRAVFASIFGIVATATVSGAQRPSNADFKKGQADAQAAADAVAAKDAKMAAVNKVITLLKDLQAKVLSEGEEEARTYNKFACFCKTTQKEKSESIKTGKSEKTSLSADISKYSKERDALDDKISKLNDAITAAQKKMKEATDLSNHELDVYQTNEADMKSAITSLTEAIKVLKSSKGPSLVQLQNVGNTVREAALMADALGLGGETAEHAASFLLQEANRDVPVEMEDYKFHSGGIVKTLENLLNEFRKEQSSLNADEVKRVQAHTMLIQDKTDFVKAKTVELDEAKKNRDTKIEEIGTASAELSTVSADLLDDMQYLDEINTMCSEKAKTWDQRSKVRADELSAITAATGIVANTVAAKTRSATVRLAQAGATIHFADAIAESDDAMESIEAEAESVEEPSFVQLASVREHKPEDDARQMVLSLLKGKGNELHSTLLTSLVTQIGSDPLAKVKKLIQELIERLLKEAANEANQKGWCDKSTADATQKREYSSNQIEDLNAKMAKLEALSAKLGEDLGTLKDETDSLKAKVKEAQENRDAEKKENALTVVEAKAGLDAVKMAIDILDKFYKTAAKEQVDLSLAQGPKDDAPKTSFDTGDAYTGAGAESGGIIGMMEVIQSDFERTISETNDAEEKARKEHLQFMTESRMSLAEKKTASKQKTKLKDEADDNLSDASQNLGAQVAILKASIKELIELKAACIDTGMSYADRVARREQEIASLKKALCILGAYAQYGPDGLSDAC